MNLVRDRLSNRLLVALCALTVVASVGTYAYARLELANTLWMAQQPSRVMRAPAPCSAQAADEEGAIDAIDTADEGDAASAGEEPADLSAAGAITGPRIVY